MILKRYINREILTTSVAILVILVLLFVSTRFIRYIQFAVDGTISSSAAFLLMGLKIPSVTGFLLPMSFYIAVLTTLGRLYAENEMAVIQSAGVSDLQIAKGILPMAAFLAICSGVLSFAVTPWANMEAKILSKKESANAKLGGFNPGKFTESKDKDGVVFVESKSSEGEITRLFAVSGIKSEGKQIGSQKLEIQIANGGQIRQLETQNQNQEATDYLVLTEGTNYSFDEKTKQWQLTQYQRYFMPLIDKADIVIDSDASSTNSFTLLGQSDPESSAELHWRLSAPLSIFILTFLALPLAKTQPRKGKFSRLFPAIMIYMVYALLLMNGRQLIEDGKTPQILGFWWIHLIAIAFCFYKFRSNRQLKASKKLKKVAHV